MSLCPPRVPLSPSCPLPLSLHPPPRVSHAASPGSVGDLFRVNPWGPGSVPPLPTPAGVSWCAHPPLSPSSRGQGPPHPPQSHTVGPAGGVPPSPCSVLGGSLQDWGGQWGHPTLREPPHTEGTPPPEQLCSFPEPALEVESLARSQQPPVLPGPAPARAAGLGGTWEGTLPWHGEGTLPWDGEWSLGWGVVSGMGSGPWGAAGSRVLWDVG